MFEVVEATGCQTNKNKLLNEGIIFDIRDFGAGCDMNPVINTQGINEAIQKAAENGGGTVKIAGGEYNVYTINLKSNVNLYLEKGSCLRAARTEIVNAYETQEGEGGNYEEPEINKYVGLQDHGHSYFANSLIYGVDIHNCMIYGEGLIDGRQLNEKNEWTQVLLGGDPFDPKARNQTGHQGEWFGNKGIALDRCKNIILSGFKIVGAGHFAIIATGVKEMLIEDLLVDTNRDALDIDCCQDVTVRNSIFNALTDDALVLKASYGAGAWLPLKNVLIEDCTVYGYDMGSVYDGTYKTDKLVATDLCKPTGRIKLGTESTCGYDQVTIRRVRFKRSRGFALEAVDGADLSNIIFEDAVMEDVSSSPIFIRAGDRGRFPVTGTSESEMLAGGEPNVRLDQKKWILPNTKDFDVYPIKRYMPSYKKDREVSVDGISSFKIIDQDCPNHINEANLHQQDDSCYAMRYDKETGKYLPDFSQEIKEEQKALYANACGYSRPAAVRNVMIKNVVVKDADPRYPVELMGLAGSRLENIRLENLDIQYRGGLSMEHATQQRQIITNWDYKEHGNQSNKVQSLSWLVNTFFLKNEGLLPRVEWDIAKKGWKDAPFNIPELPEVYPEPSNWGILPAYGIYARHVEKLYMSSVRLTYQCEDGRYPIVLDDIEEGMICDIKADSIKDIEKVVVVENAYKRPSGFEYVKDYPYYKTGVNDVEIDKELTVKQIKVEAPAPGTPKDTLYLYETVAIPQNGYNLKMPTSEYPLPQTVYRPFFESVSDIQVQANEEVCFDIRVRQPAYEVSTNETDGRIYNESVQKMKSTTKGIQKPLSLRIEHHLTGVDFDTDDYIPGLKRSFSWTPSKGDVGVHRVVFIANDGIIPVKMNVNIEVLD